MKILVSYQLTSHEMLQMILNQHALLPPPKNSYSKTA